MCFVPILRGCVGVACLRLCKEEWSSPVYVINERRDMGLYEVLLSMSLLVFGMGTMLDNLVKQFAICFGLVVILLLNVMEVFRVCGGALVD